MGIFSGIGTAFSNMRNIAQGYVETKVELLKLQAADKVSTLFATIIAWIVLTLFLLFFLVFASIALAYVLSEWIGRAYSGFLIVSGLYLLVGYFVFKGRERLLRRPILNAIIKQLFSEKPAEEKHRDE